MEMEIIAFPGSVRTAPPTSWDTRRIGKLVSRDDVQAGRDLLKTLPAIPDHDLRQPLRLIASAHDAIAPTLDLEEGRGSCIPVVADAPRYGTRPLAQLDPNSLRRKVRASCGS
jgi:hypothetical protein